MSGAIMPKENCVRVQRHHNDLLFVMHKVEHIDIQTHTCTICYLAIELLSRDFPEENVFII